MINTACDTGGCPYKNSIEDMNPYSKNSTEAPNRHTTAHLSQTLGRDAEIPLRSATPLGCGLPHSRGHEALFFQRATIADLAEAEQDALRWLRLRATGLKSGVRVDFSSPDGLDELYRDTVSYLRHYDLAENESRFAADYACKFHHSENVKAQRLVIAEMGLVPYEGTILREDRELEGRFSRRRRREYVLRRLGFVRALYKELRVETVLVYRGIHCVDLPTRPSNRTFVSSTTNLAVAESLACYREPVNENKAGYKVGVLMSQRVPVERVFMTYMETAEMNSPYSESEVVLLYSADEGF